MNQIECIAKELSWLKAELPQFLVIGSLTFRYDVTEVPRALEKVKYRINSRKREQGTLYTVKFDKASGLQSGMFFEVSSAALSAVERCGESNNELAYFTERAILDFVNRIGDDNPIHRGVHPVVPGLMTLETLWTIGVKDQLITKGLAHVKFKRPLYEHQGFRVICKKSSMVVVNVRNEQIAELILEESNE